MSNYPPREPSLHLNINAFSGMNTHSHSSRILDNEAEFIDNFYIKENGVLSKRRGITNIFSVDYQDSILCMQEFKGFLIIGTMKGIYKLNLETYAKQQIYAYEFGSGTSFPSFIKMFVLSGKLFILDGINFMQYDGEKVEKVQDKAYIPTLFITTSPNGDGVPLEQWNLLSDSFKQSFSADGTSANYLLCLGQFSVVSVTVDGELKLPVTHYHTEYRPNTGRIEIQFNNNSIPAKGTDNIVVVAKYPPDMPFFKEKIAMCRERVNKASVYSFYGGQNDTRLLLAGQDSVFYRSDVYNPCYFPENYYQSVGDTEEKITGFVTQYDYCVILKEKSIWHTRFELLDSGITTYTTKPLNAQFGCKNGNTIQLVNNAPMFLSDKGIAVINQTQVRDERNVQIISERINSLLLQDRYVKNGVSVDFDNKYMIGAENKIYIYDYIYDCFYVWSFGNETSVMISSFAIVKDTLFIGTRNGVTYRIRNANENTFNLHNDEIQNRHGATDVLPIKAIWKSKLFNFDNPNVTKVIENLFITISPHENSSVDVSYLTDKNNEIYIDKSSSNLFTYDFFDYKKMSYLSNFQPVNDNMKVKLKKAVYFQLILKNFDEGESLDIYNIGIKFKNKKEVK